MPYILAITAISIIIFYVYRYYKDDKIFHAGNDSNIEDAEYTEAHENEQETIRQEQGSNDSAEAEDNNEPQKQYNDMNVEKILTDFLIENGCKAESYPSGESSVYYFKFNGGAFRAVINTRINDILLNYDAFYEAPTKDTDRICRILNEVNNKYKYFKITYSFDEKSNKIELNLAYEIYRVTKEEIDFFVNSAAECAGDIREKVRDTSYMNLSAENTLDNIRQNFLVNEAELAAQKPMFSADAEHPLSLSNLTITSKETVTTISDTNEICSFNIIPTVYDNDVLYHNTTMLLQTRDNDYLIALDATSQDDFTVYIRLTIMLIRHNSEDKTEIASHQPNAITLLVGYDKQTDANRHAEYQYMLTDAKDKIAEGRESELTEEQKFILNWQANYFSEQLYTGKKMFLNGRYYEAIVALQPAFIQMMRYFMNYNKEQKDAFFDIAFMLGFSYTELQQYDRAFYYLHLINPVGMVSYSSEYINALANASDIRVFNEIDQLIETTCESRKAEDIPDNVRENLQKFYEFLLRRKGFSYINYGSYDAAENIFKQLLDSPYSRDYAENELAFIKQLRRQQSAKDNN